MSSHLPQPALAHAQSGSIIRCYAERRPLLRAIQDDGHAFGAPTDAATTCLAFDAGGDSAEMDLRQQNRLAAAARSSAAAANGRRSDQNSFHAGSCLSAVAIVVCIRATGLDLAPERLA